MQLSCHLKPYWQRSEISCRFCEELILHKLLAGRIIDLTDAAALLRANRATMDLAYLRRWIDEKALETDFAAIWAEAFPDEPLA